MSLKVYQESPWRALNPTKKEIRAVEISPAQSPLDPIICYLRTVSLPDKPKYEALTYVWGLSSDDRHILLDGNEISVTDSLFEALVHLRDVRKKRILWVDALCINQKDDAEKNNQVMMMDKIYAQASTVLVWLLNSELPELLDDINWHSQNQERHFTKFPTWFLPLSSSSWWYRAWTFQEAALAENLIFHTGHGSFSLKALEGYCNSLYQHLFRSNPCCYAVLHDAMSTISQISSTYSMIRELSSNRRIISRGEKSLLDLILNNRYRLATKPQDRVYAYLGLACDVPTDLVKYELPLQQWNIHISTKLIQHNRSLKIVRFAGPLRFIRVDMQRMDRLPSWCPDWTLSTEIHESMMIMGRYGKLDSGEFAASGRTKANTFFPMPEILGVSGVVCDTIADVGCDSSKLYGAGRENSNLWGAGTDPETLWQWCQLVANNTSFYKARCDKYDKIIYGIRKKCLECPNFDLCSKCFNKPRELHLNHSFNSIQSNPMESQNYGSYHCKEIQSSGWEKLGKIAYPFNEGDTLQDAFRNVLVRKVDPDLLFGHSDHGLDDKSREASILLKIAFEKYWHLRVENRPEVDFIMKEGYAMELGNLASVALTKASVNLIAAMVRGTLMWMRLFVSSKGYIGWGPKEMCVGDTIAVLHGSDMPFVLRPVPKQLSKTDTGSGYTVIGVCYVHGLMRGEALENEEMEKREFLLY